MNLFIITFMGLCFLAVGFCGFVIGKDYNNSMVICECREKEIQK